MLLIFKQISLHLQSLWPLNILVTEMRIAILAWELELRLGRK